MRDAPFAGGRGGSPAAAGQGRCRTRGRRTRGGSSPSCGSPPFCFGRRTLCCRKAPLTGTAAKIREPCGRPVRVVVRERRISWVGAPVLPLGCGKAGFVLFGKRVEAVWRYLPLRRLRAGRDDAARAAGAQEEEVPPLVNHPLFALDGARFAAAKLPLSGSLRKYGSLAGDRFA